jgi:hypothetical protein
MGHLVDISFRLIGHLVDIPFLLIGSFPDRKDAQEEDDEDGPADADQCDHIKAVHAPAPSVVWPASTPPWRSLIQGRQA